MDFALTPEQAHWQEVARAFAQGEVAPLAREADARGEFPLHLVARMGELGFLGGTVPREDGGSGLDSVSYALVCEELGRADSSVRGFLTVHAGLVAGCIAQWGSAAQRAAYLPGMARGSTIGCYALTEPEAGSDVAAIASTAREDGDSYVLDGEKIWITNGTSAHVAIVFASRDRAARHKGLCAFLVDTNTPGFTREPMPGVELGHRASEHVRITLKGCRVPAMAMLGAAGEGFKVAMSGLDRGRLGVAAGAVGVAQACLDASVAYTTGRRQFGSRV
ncbi:MAG TPA: acyl-CoA dehydrogenase family protein, partial [Chloroflexia bacterium]|nr:acyl-CoA dehydrogenase family protein [Chloroflexia bacterium]